MTDGQNGIKHNDAPKPARKKNSGGVFGLMSKRRWFIVVVFLSSVTWSYTAGPPLSEAYISNRYFTNPGRFDYSTEAILGNTDLIWNIFEKKFFMDTWIWQAGAYFHWLEGPMWMNDKLYFSDTIENRIYSYNEYQGTQIEMENSGDATNDQIKKLFEGGSNGLLNDPRNERQMFIAQHAARRIVLYNIDTKKKEVIVDKYNGKKLNAPNDMAIDFNNEYLYFTDPVYGLQLKSEILKSANTANNGSISVSSETYADKLSELGFSGIYRVNINPKSKDYKNIELIDKTLHRPNGIAISNTHNIKNNKNLRLYVTNSIRNEFNMNIYEIDIKTNNVKFIEKWDINTIQKNIKNDKNKILTNGKISWPAGATDGMTVFNKKGLANGYLFVTCPESKLCIINENNGQLEAAIKLADGVQLSNVVVGKDNNLYITANGNLWQIKLNPLN